MPTPSRLFLLVCAIAMTVVPGPIAVAGDVKENVYRGELVSYPGPWSFQIGKSAIILVSDKQLEDALAQLPVTSFGDY